MLRQYIYKDTSYKDKSYYDETNYNDDTSYYQLKLVTYSNIGITKLT